MVDWSIREDAKSPSNFLWLLYVFSSSNIRGDDFYNRLRYLTSKITEQCSNVFEKKRIVMEIRIDTFLCILFGGGYFA